ncbi:MAG: hypothetical protein RMK57_06605 [Bryobacterales bacterium]|nr:hypothetical protein [Bryobacterales bacterium]
MKRPIRIAQLAAIAGLASALLWAQVRPTETEEPRLPSGTLQREAILKAEYERTLEDAARLVDLAQELKAELEKNTRHVLSVSSLRKTEEIEKLAKRIRSRLRKF